VPFDRDQEWGRMAVLSSLLCGSMGGVRCGAALAEPLAARLPGGGASPDTLSSGLDRLQNSVPMAPVKHLLRHATALIQGGVTAPHGHG
jgi:hypothetical protein